MKTTFKDKLILEALDFFKIDSLLNNDPDSDDDFDVEAGDDIDFGLEDEFSLDDDFEDDDFDIDSEFSDSDEDFSFGDEGDDTDFMDFDDDLGGSDGELSFDEESEQDPNRQGMIRNVRGAYMVYKKMSSNNSYEELWVYNLGDVKYQTKIRNAILSGTDIDPIDMRSPDNDQTATIWSKGNVQFLHINGLPN